MDALEFELRKQISDLRERVSILEAAVDESVTVLEEFLARQKLAEAEKKINRETKKEKKCSNTTAL